MAKNFIYLASASPRRSELLTQIGVAFQVMPAAVAETPLTDEDPAGYVERVATEKANAVWAKVADHAPAPVLAADTTVVAGGEILGKPQDERDALAMLERISGGSHTVFTAIALRSETEQEALLTRTEVRFRATTAAERIAYCRSGEPFDKAGAYAIQGLGAVFIEHIVGSYSAVMGLPLAETASILARFGLPAWVFDSATRQ